MADTDTMRDEFEAWITSWPRRGHVGTYADAIALEIWQAAWRARAKRDINIVKSTVTRGWWDKCIEEIKKDAGL